MLAEKHSKAQNTLNKTAGHKTAGDSLVSTSKCLKLSAIE